MSRLRWILKLTCLTTGVLSLCFAQSASQGYLQHNLVADTPGVADFTDPNAVNVWGIATSAASPFWVCDGGTGLSTVYTVNNTGTAVFGAISGTKPSVPGPGNNGNGVCTGIVANSVATAFNVSTTAQPTPRQASFIFSTEEGTISGWANATDPARAVLTVDNSGKAVYKGLAIVTAPTPQLYAANFFAGTIDVFDANYKPVTLAAGAFTDPAVPAGFAPFNVWNLGGKLYVTYAKQDATKKLDVFGVGNGYVSVFDPTGKLLSHLISGGVLNSPWGVAIATANFGKYANALLVGNFGDGLIHAYNADTGALLGTLQDPAGKDIVIPGLWGLISGNGGSGGDRDAIYFGAGPGGQKHGLLGSLQAAPVVSASNVVNAGQIKGAIAPNTFVTIAGANLAATKRSWATADFAGNKLPTSLDGVKVTVNGKDAYVSYISPIQINLITPADIAISGQVDVIVSDNGLTSATLSVPVQAAAPSFFLFNTDKYIAATHSDNKSLIGPPTLIANATTPAKPGETIVLYANGLGATTPAIVNGAVFTTSAPLATLPTVTFNGTAVQVTFAGLTGNGLYQINVVVPNGLPNGDATVIATVGGFSSPQGALITVQN